MLHGDSFLPCSSRNERRNESPIISSAHTEGGRSRIERSKSPLDVGGNPGEFVDSRIGKFMLRREKRFQYKLRNMEKAEFRMKSGHYLRSRAVNPAEDSIAVEFRCPISGRRSPTRSCKTNPPGGGGLPSNTVVRR
jgi:hypothetical protein